MAKYRIFKDDTLGYGVECKKFLFWYEPIAPGFEQYRYLQNSFLTIYDAENFAKQHASGNFRKNKIGTVVKNLGKL